MVSNTWLKPAVALAAGLGGFGLAVAHPGHAHDGIAADIIHLWHALGPLLPVLLLGVAGAAAYRLLNRGR